MKNKLAQLSNKVLNHYYSHLPYDCNDDLILILLSKADTSCYSKKELSDYKQLIDSLTFDCAEARKEVLVDSSKKEDWEINNPMCVNRKLWERLAYKICKNYGITLNIEKVNKTCPDPNLVITKKDLECNISMDIVTKNLECDILTSIYIVKKACNDGFEVTRSLDECKLDYKLLNEKHPELNLSFKDYYYLVGKKFTFDAIDTIYCNRASLLLSDNSIYIKSPFNTYDLNSIDLDKLLISKLNGPKLVIQLLKDYKINNVTKQLILNGTTYI